MDPQSHNQRRRRLRLLVILALLILVAGLCWHFSQPRKLIVTKIFADTGYLLSTSATGIVTVNEEDSVAGQMTVRIYCLDWSGRQRYCITYAKGLSQEPPLPIDSPPPICVSPNGRLVATAIATAKGMQLLSWHDGKPEKPVEFTVEFKNAKASSITLNIKDDGEMLIAHGPWQSSDTELFAVAHGRMVARGKTQGHMQKPPSSIRNIIWYTRSFSANGQAMLINLNYTDRGREAEYASPEYVSLQIKGKGVEAIHRYSLNFHRYGFFELLADGSLTYSEGSRYDMVGRIIYRKKNPTQIWSADGKYLAEVSPNRLEVSKFENGKVIFDWQAAVQLPYGLADTDITADGQYAVTALTRSRHFYGFEDMLSWFPWFRRLRNITSESYSITIYQQPGQQIATRSFRVILSDANFMLSTIAPAHLQIKGKHFSLPSRIILSPDGKHVLLSVAGVNGNPNYVLLEAR